MVRTILFLKNYEKEQQFRTLQQKDFLKGIPLCDVKIEEF